MWMNCPGWVVHKRAFVTLGHKSLPSACSGVGHKGIVQYAPVGGRAMPETYGYVRTSRPRVSELAGSDPETQRQQMLAAGVALSHIYQDVGVSGTSGTNSRRGWHSLDSRLGSGRHPDCGVHRPHRAALAGHHGQHPRPATARGEDSQPGR